MERSLNLSSALIGYVDDPAWPPHVRSQIGCTWLSVAGVLLAGFAMYMFMGFLPLLPPNMPAGNLAAVYRNHATGIILGAVLLMISQASYFPMFGVLAVQMRRMEGPHMVWTYTMLTAAVLAYFPIMPAAIYFMMAAYRPERSAEAVQALSDLGFVFLLIPAIPTTLMAFAIAFATFGDRRDKPVLPRWSAYFNIWMGLLFLPAATIALFKSGPFAWNGLIAFWLVFGIFGLWIFMLVYVLLRAISGQAALAVPKIS